tara:strand:- start:339 stop:1913 length:1575 start_codon:yes stop_codon:yes gene_type:complete
MGKKRYNQLKDERESYLLRARRCSELTLPLVVRDKHYNKDTSDISFASPWSSLGARGVNNLSSNLMLSLFPTNLKFFRLLVSDNAFEEYGDQAEQVKAEVDTSLATIEETVFEEIEDKNLRPVIFEALKNLIIAGNSLLYVQPDGNIRNYALEDYVVHRDVEGNICDIIAREQISKTVAENLGIDTELPSEDGFSDNDKNIDLYTCVHLTDDNEYYIYQEVNGNILKDTVEYVPLDKLPFLPLRMSKVTGESYGRSYVEGLYGDLRSLEGLTKAMVEAAAISAKIVFMVNPASTTRARSIAQAENGDVINGNSSDVTTLQANKGADMNVAFQAAQNIEQRLAFAFNLLDNALPAGGRTTATEINHLISSLEKVLAGTYAMLSSEFARPLVRIIVNRLTEEKKIPELPKEVKLIISTGVSSLGRTSDLERLQQFVGMATQMTPEAYGQVVDQRALMQALVRAVGVDTNILKSDEQLGQEQQQAMMAQQQQMEQQQAMMQQQQAGRVVEKVAPQLVQQAQQEQVDE